MKHTIPQTRNTTVDDRIDKLQTEVITLFHKLTKLNQENRSRRLSRSRSRESNRSRSRRRSASTMCWYHQTYGNRTWKCRSQSRFKRINNKTAPLIVSNDRHSRHSSQKQSFPTKPAHALYNLSKNVETGQDTNQDHWTSIDFKFIVKCQHDLYSAIKMIMLLRLKSILETLQNVNLLTGRYEPTVY